MSLPLEIEVKFIVRDPDDIRRRLLDLGARGTGRHFESNIRYEDRRGSLARSGSLLRLRKDRRALLTFKSRGPDEDPDYKVHRELEVEVSDFERTSQILLALGFTPAQRYEKWRETYHLEDTEFCLDSMPFGEFLEIEGGRAEIRRFAAHLGLTWEERILDNYLGLFSRLRERLDLTFSDVTFENFKAVRIEPGVLASILEPE